MTKFFGETPGTEYARYHEESPNIKIALHCQSRGIWSIGAVGRCLSRQLAESKPLTLECRSLVLVAAPRVSSPISRHPFNVCLLLQVCTIQM